MRFIPTLYRYIIRELLAVFFATCFILLAIILSFRLANLLSAAASGEVTLHAVWQLIYLQSIRFLVVLMPLAFVLASALTFGRLYRDHEISAMLAAGIGQTHLLKALIWIASPIALTLAALTLNILPGIYQRQEHVLQQAQQEAGLTLLTPNTFQQIDTGIIAYTSAIKNGLLADFFVSIDQGQQHSIITSQTGNIQEKTHHRFLHLQDGQRFSWTDGFAASQISIEDFKEGILRMPSAKVVNSNRLRTIPTLELNDSITHQAEWQTRLNPILALCIFTLSLPLLTQIKPRQGRYQKILPIFLLFALYINLLDTFVTMIKKETIAIYPGSYSIHMAVLVLITIMWWQHERIKRL